MIHELRCIGKPTRYFTDETMLHEVRCTCGPQPIDGRTRIEVESCEAHGRARNPQNWPNRRPIFDPNWRDSER